MADAGRICRYRLSYSKKGKAAFFSHLDVIRIFERAARRTGLAFSFTCGFNPHIRFSAAWALPVGLAVERETISFRFERDYGAEEVGEAFNRQLPAGFHVESVDGEKNDASLPRELVFEIETGAQDSCMRDAVVAWKERDRVEVARIREGRTEIIDVGKFLGEVTAGAGRITVRVLSVDGALPRMSDLLKAFHEIPSFASSPMEVHGVTRLA
jgi:radical SAM-linked protein